MDRSAFLAGVALLLLALASPLVVAHEKVKLTGNLVDVMCATGHAKDKPEDAMRFAAEHSKSRQGQA